MSSTLNPIGWKFDNTYARLPDEFFARVDPTPVRAPKIAILNRPLAATLGLNADALDTDDGAAVLSGNRIAEGCEPIAQAYAGHQFGGFTMLGDGRAHLLGELVTPKGERFDLQLKGSGPTPFSRRGDGRAALGPMLREYIVSEAMFGLGIPTTRSLAVVSTGENVRREAGPLPGGILSRIAASHIRVGTFEYAAGINQPENLKLLADYTIARHFPELTSQNDPYLRFLHAVMDRQAYLIARWMHVGFIHGVMNTDNMALSGETIDYGPCAFMDRYSRATVFSSIDHQGRYAYGNQPRIAHWNLSRFAETLLPLFSKVEPEAIAMAEATLEKFPGLLQGHWLSGMRSKFGLTGADESDVELIESFLVWLEEVNLDHTNTFRALSFDRLAQADPEWIKRWRARGPSLELMRKANPAVIARNHLVEEALTAATERGDFTVMQRLLEVLKNPYQDLPSDSPYGLPGPVDAGYQTFCGT